MNNQEFTSINAESIKVLNKEICDLPEKIYNAEVAMNKARGELQQAKFELDVQEAAQYLLSEGKTVKERECSVTGSTSELAKKVVAADAALLVATAGYNKAINEFAAIRKLAGLAEAALQAKI